MTVGCVCLSILMEYDQMNIARLQFSHDIVHCSGISGLSGGQAQALIQKKKNQAYIYIYICNIHYTKTYFLVSEIPNLMIIIENKN